MKNRAKCKICQLIIESYHSTDYVSCKCGHIAVDGGVAMRCYADDWNNFVRVDDEGNEIIIKICNELPSKLSCESINPEEKPSKEKMLELLDEMIKTYDSLPEHAKSTYVSHYDLLSALILISSILRS